MKVLHIIPAIDRSGGANAGLTLHESLRAIGVESAVQGAGHVLDTDRVAGFRSVRGLRPALHRLAREAGQALSLPGVLDASDRMHAARTVGSWPDLVHLHVTHVADIGWPYLAWLGERFPIAWTLHDLWPLTGNCIYPMDCTRWRGTCGSCPQLDVYPRLRMDTTPALRRLKRSLVRGMHPHFIAPSKWVEQAALSLADSDGFSASFIPHGIDCSAFEARDSGLARQALGFAKRSDDEPVLLALGSRWTDPRKGLDAFLAFLAHVRRTGRKMTVLAIELPAELLSHGSDRLGSAALGSDTLRVINLPLASTTAAMLDYYSAADVCLSFSKVETFGLSIAESHACGKPVVALDAPAVVELVDGELWGSRVAQNDWGALLAAIDRHLTEPRAQAELRRSSALERYDLTAYARAHETLYRGLLDARM